MEWWEKQDRLEAQGWVIEGDTLRWPDGSRSPLAASWDVETTVNHVVSFVEALREQCPNLSIWEA